MQAISFNAFHYREKALKDQFVNKGKINIAYHIS